MRAERTTHNEGATTMTTTGTTDPDWLTVGATVALFRYGTSSRGGSVKFVTVERLTITRVVLSDGSWVRRDRLSRSDGASAWGGTTYLRPAHDEQVAKAVLEAKARARAADVDLAYDEWRRNRTGKNEATRLDALIAAAQAARAALDTESETTR